MIASYLKVIVVCSAMLTFAVLLIRAQPLDNHDLRAFMAAPDTCPAPCFMGIRPGVTTEAEALALLENHEWVRAISPPLTRSFVTIRWTWSGAQPAFIDPASPGVIRLFSDRRVSTIQVSTHIPLEQMRLLLGTPTWFNVAQYDMRDRAYYFAYTDHHLLLWVEAQRCSGTQPLLAGSTSFAFMSEIIESPYAFLYQYIHRPNLYHLKQATTCPYRR
jgi:hypothetical protein